MDGTVAARNSGDVIQKAGSNFEDSAQGEDRHDLCGVQLAAPGRSRVFLPGEIDAFILSSSDPCNSLARLIL